MVEEVMPHLITDRINSLLTIFIYNKEKKFFKINKVPKC